MTGFGSGRAVINGCRFSVEARSVNGRFLEVRARLPHAISEWAPVVEDVARRHLVRGRVELTVRMDAGAPDLPVLDRRRAQAALEQLRSLRDEVAPGEPVPLSLLASVPDLFGEHPLPTAEDVRAALHAAAQQACEALQAMQQREGVALEADFVPRIAAVERNLASVGERTPKMVESYRERLKERIDRLLAPGSVSADAGRLEQEIALLADKSDVTEEVTRLTSHCAQFRAECQGESDAVGRKLDFLVQEMIREANTIGSKSPDVEIAHAVVEIKAELERIREQVQNVI